MRKLLAFIALPGLLVLSAAAQSTPSPSNPVTRTTKAVNYRLRGNDVKVDFHGTELMANATGEAKVAGKKSSVEIDAMFEARNAVRIDHIAAADKYANTIIARADQQLRSAEEAYTRKRDKGTIDSLAREAVSTAEEARVMAVKQKAEEEAQAKAAADK